MPIPRAILTLLALVLTCGVVLAQKPILVHRTYSEYPSGYADWLDQAVAGIAYHGPRWSDGTYNTSNFSGYGQYEPWYGFLRIAQHIGGDATIEGYADDACDVWRDGYSVANGGAILGYFNYTDGLRLDWTENADTTSRDALIDQAVSATYATGSTSAIMKSEAYSREVAYAVLGYINSEVYCGEAHNSRMEPMVELMLADVGASVNISGATTLSAGGHIEQWLGTVTTDSEGNITGGTHNFTEAAAVDEAGNGFAPFMGAITGYTLIRHYELSASINGGITPDVRIPAKLVRLFDAMWPYYWIEADSSMKLRWINTDGAPALNNMMAVVYWWLYKETGDRRHLERGDLLFNGTVGYESLDTPSVGGYKEFYELIRWTIDGLEWRAEGVGLHGG